MPRNNLNTNCLYCTYAIFVLSIFFSTKTLFYSFTLIALETFILFDHTIPDPPIPDPPILNPPILLLNISDSYYFHQERDSRYAVDVLTIGSYLDPSMPVVQRKTWGSHKNVRNFWLATEFDDPDPSCHQTMTREDLQRYVWSCRNHWVGKYAHTLTKHFRSNFARMEWLLKKANPEGWMCAQKRFGTALSKLLLLYRDNDMDPPDYLIFADADTHVNMGKLVEELLQGGGDYPGPEVPVVYVGCRIRSPAHMVNFTWPFGGYGTFFSRAAIERAIAPLTSISEIPVHSIGEEQHWRQNVNTAELMGDFFKAAEPLCANSDWIVGYFVNYYNLSRHVPTSSSNWWDQRMGNIPQNRLHIWNPKSEIYKVMGGDCAKSGSTCDADARTCYYMDEENMKSIHDKMKLQYPDQFLDIQI